MRPSCWIALSALQGSSIVTCTRRRWFPAPRHACREMPVDAASLITATSLSPRLNAAFSRRLTPSTSPSFAMDPAAARPAAARGSARDSKRNVVPDARAPSRTSSPESSESPFPRGAATRTTRARRPVISATAAVPPNSSMSSSRKLGGRFRSSACARRIRLASTHSAFSANSPRVEGADEGATCHVPRSSNHPSSAPPPPPSFTPTSS